MNLLSYFAFLIPLTSLAVYGHMNEGTLCIKDNSTESGYEVLILHSSFLSGRFIDVRESDRVAWWCLREVTGEIHFRLFKISRRSNNGVVRYCIVYNPGACFSKVPKRFRTQKAMAESQTL